MEKPKFVHVTYIRTTPEKLWQALTSPDYTRRYFSGTLHESTWEKGATWRMMIPDGRVADSGEVLESDPPRRLVLSWTNQFRPELHADGPSRMTYLLEPMDGMVKFTVIHESDTPGSKLIQAVSNGWPMILASLKSFLETGEPLAATANWPKDDKCISK